MEPLNSMNANMDADFNQGNLLRAQGKLDEAIACFRRAIALNPRHIEAQNNLGNALKAKGLLDEAIVCFQDALRQRPDYAEAYSNLGNVLQEQENFDEAVACYRRAAELKPEIAEVHHNLANALQAQGNLDEAVVSFQRALALKPGLLETLNNLGTAYQELRRLDEAIDFYRRALALAPDYARSRMNLSQIMLLRGDLAHGWPEYEWRWKTGQLAVPCYAGPVWNGEPLNGKKILLHAEQGLGDTIQFIRYAQIVKALGATVVVECQKPLTKLLASCAGIDRLLAAGGYLPHFNFHLPLLSLPRIFKTDLASIPARVPYISADPVLVEAWREKLKALKGFRVGINWRGREGKIESRRRDVPLALFRGLAQIPGVQLVSLQKGAGRADLAAAGFAVFDPGDNLDTAHGPFMDSAAIMENLDLVITSDTSIPHLAGALGVPVWVALPFFPDWRWMLDRTDSPWYPTMRLFRQSIRGDWHGVFEKIRDELGKLVSSVKK
jgi:tetratricopeptide (TPR) repeat protein